MESLLAASFVPALAVATSLPAAAQSVVWMQQFGTNVYEELMAAAPDGFGGVFVGGGTGGNLGAPNAGSYDAWLARRDSSGGQMWIRQFGTDSGDWLYDAAPDGSGGVYACGPTSGVLVGTNAGGQDAWLARYDSAGNPVWIRQFGTSSFDDARAAAADASGGVFVAGWTNGSLGGSNPTPGNKDIWIARYDSFGSRAWIRQFGMAGDDCVGGAAPDGSGGVYLGGDTYGDLGGTNAGGLDAWIARYDGQGNRTWIRQLGTVGDDRIEFHSVAPDGAGGLYVGGHTTGNLAAPNAGGYDAWLARYDGAGNQIWIRQLGSNGSDELYAAVPDAFGGIGFAGWTNGGLSGGGVGNYDAWLARYDGAGNQRAITQFGTSVLDRLWVAATDGSTGVYLGGATSGALAGPQLGGGDAWLARYDWGASSSYCTPGTTTNACLPSIASSGTPSASASSGFTIAVSTVEGQRQGMLFYGVDNAGFGPLPWGQSSSYLCVKAPTQRTPAHNAGGTLAVCDGVLALDWNAFRATNPGALGQPFTVGQHVYAQGWFRDPPSPKTTMLSDALEFVVLP